MQLTKYASIAILASAVSNAWAGPVPVYSFGTLTNATFGGTGIPNNAVAITKLGDATLGLTAHQRYGNPALTNDGVGVFHALPGVDTNPPSPANPYALWNFGFYVDGGTASYTYRLYYDFDPGVNTAQASQGRGVIIPSFSNQNSWNLGMDFLATSSLFFSAPTTSSFNPNAPGEYSFALVAYEDFWATKEVGRSAIRVRVSDVPEPGSLALVGIALLGLAGIRRRKA